MFMDVRGPEPIFEEPAPEVIPYIIIGVLIILGIVLTIYMVKKNRGDKNEKNNK